MSHHRTLTMSPSSTSAPHPHAAHAMISQGTMPSLLLPFILELPGYFCIFIYL
ncbi:hypothetical protein E2C01_034358 [Portunus trituberculatus]|uniref:Uncharacterized protein n=1 Tax=Portunus trituberculatus TaxID=210409 RepID=A0A5B7F0G4_PORTR|nr:hypothetical protein [Portunus trituberculatus]